MYKFRTHNLTHEKPSFLRATVIELVTDRILISDNNNPLRSTNYS